MTGDGPVPPMSNSEILAVSKILLESRAFGKKEMEALLNKLVEGCVPLRNMKLVSDLIANEKYHYVELTHPIRNPDILWKSVRRSGAVIGLRSTTEAGCRYRRM